MSSHGCVTVSQFLGDNIISCAELHTHRIVGVHFIQMPSEIMRHINHKTKRERLCAVQ